MKSLTPIRSFIRRFLCCRLQGTHWNVERERPEHGLASAGVCLDCGTAFPEVTFTAPPKPSEPPVDITRVVLASIGDRLRTQDNRATMHPMFCVQQKKRDVGYDAAYSDNRCWHDGANDETIFDDDPGFAAPPEGDEWDEFGYVDRWVTVMVAFTEQGCKEYLEQNGHNHRGETRIYVESFYRCPEMIAIREALIAGKLT